MNEKDARKAYYKAAQDQRDHIHGKDPCQVCWAFHGSAEWASWLMNRQAGSHEDHPCETRRELEAELAKKTEEWIGS